MRLAGYALRKRARSWTRSVARVDRRGGFAHGLIVLGTLTLPAAVGLGLVVRLPAQPRGARPIGYSPERAVVGWIGSINMA